MKNFARKSFVAALMVLPLLSHAASTDCGGGTISALRENSNNSPYSALIMNWSSSMPFKGNQTWYDAVIVRNDKARTAASGAFYSKTFVRLFTSGNSCVNIDEVVLCKDEDTCRNIGNIY